MNRTTRAAVVAATLLLPGSFLVARAGWVKAKGAVGEALIHRALAATLKDGRPRRPWSWADMHPIARLTVPRLGIERPVLDNATGPALAFGIGHVDGTAQPSASGHCVLAGHRDSWAAFLEDVQVGDAVVVEAFGRKSAYRVNSIAVVRFDDGRVLRDEGDSLILVTCWPFRGWLHSPWRYVVRATRSRLESGDAAFTPIARRCAGRRGLGHSAPRAAGCDVSSPGIGHDRRRIGSSSGVPPARRTARSDSGRSPAIYRGQPDFRGGGNDADPL